MSGFNKAMQSAMDGGFSESGGGPGTTQTCPFGGEPPTDPTRPPCFIPVMMVSAVTQKKTENNTVKDVSEDKLQVIYKDGTTPGLPSEVLGHLKGDDLLMQVISSTDLVSPVQVKVPGTEKVVHTFDKSYSTDEPVSVFAQIDTQPECSVGAHPLNEVFDAKDRSRRDSFGAYTKQFQVIAPKAGSIFSGDIWRLLWPFSPSAHHTYYVDGYCCGIHSDPTQTAPKRVRARVEVFRQKSVTVKLKLPSARTLSRKKARYKDLKTGETVTERSRSETKAFGQVRDSETIKEGKRADGKRSSFIKVTEKTTETGYIQSAKEEHTYEKTGALTYKTTHKQETSTDRHGLLFEKKDVKRTPDWEAGQEWQQDKNDGIHRLKDFSRPAGATDKDDDFKPEEVTTTMRDAVEIHINGRRVDVHILGAMLLMPSKARAFIKEIKEAVPKIGWWAEFDMKLFTSELTLTGTMSPSASGLHDRVWLLERHATLMYKGELFAVSASIAFGFEYQINGFLVSAPTLSIIAKVQFGFEKSMDLTLEFDSRRVLEVEPKLTTKQDSFYGEVVGEATLFGFGYRASGKFTFGFKFTIEGRISAHRENELKGKLDYGGLFVDFEFREHGEVKASKRIKIGEKDKELWRGDIIGGSRGSGDMTATDASARAKSAVPN